MSFEFTLASCRQKCIVGEFCAQEGAINNLNSEINSQYSDRPILTDTQAKEMGHLIASCQVLGEQLEEVTRSSAPRE